MSKPVPDEFYGEFYQEIGAKIKARRRFLKMSQAELAERVHLVRPSIANIEAGNQKMLLHTFYDIAEVLDCELADLLP